jgi:hypothetical protein
MFSGFQPARVPVNEWMFLLNQSLDGNTTKKPRENFFWNLAFCLHVAGLPDPA